MSLGTLGPRAFICSKRISQAVPISSWPIRKRRMSPGGSERWICMMVINFVRDDDSHWLCSIWSSMYTDIPNKVAGFIYGFKMFKSNVLIKISEISNNVDLKR